MQRRLFVVLFVLVITVSFLVHFTGMAYSSELAAETLGKTSSTPWWVWPLVLFVVTFFLGIVAVLGGVGGGVLFVPIIGGFFPFHIDFVGDRGFSSLLPALAAGTRAPEKRDGRPQACSPCWAYRIGVRHRRRNVGTCSSRQGCQYGIRRNHTRHCRNHDHSKKI